MGLTAKQIGIETLRAFVVLALAFLSFGHGSAFAASAGDQAAVTIHAGISYCVDAPDDEGSKAHVPCHACRLGAAADLPAPPCDAAQAPVVASPVTYFRPTHFVAPRLTEAAARPRAPPALV